MNDSAEKQIVVYLEQVRKRLGPLRSADVDEILAELRGHIVERSGGDAGAVAAAIAALGSPGELASEYVTDAVLTRAEISRSPVRILRAAFHWATLSIGGMFVLFGAVAGYGIGGLLLLGALAKLIHPHTAGLWVFGSGDNVEISLHMGFASAPGGGREVLGWWLVPIGLVGGCGLLALTTRFAVWCLKAYRVSRNLPGGAR